MLLALFLTRLFFTGGNLTGLKEIQNNNLCVVKFHAFEPDDVTEQSKGDIFLGSKNVKEVETQKVFSFSNHVQRNQQKTTGVLKSYFTP